MQFKKGKSSPFYDGLRPLAEAYLRQQPNGRYATPAILFKGLLLCFLYALSYAGIYFFAGQTAWLMGCYGLMGLSGVMLVFNIVHDASHHALLPGRINNRIRYLGDLVGINTYIWDIRHNVQHHSFTNVLGGDIIIENIPLLRISPHQPHRAFHRWQRYYAPLLYMLYSLYWILVIDIRLFFQKDICNLKNIRHPRKEWVKLWLFKGFYVLYMLVLPVWLTPLSVGQALLLFLLMHAVGGLLLSTVAVLGHFVEGPVFPEPQDGQLPNSWSEHELEATIDFAPRSRWMHWITGGLNTHVAHHLFPQVCHAHYYGLTQVIADYCRQHGYPYRGETLWAAFGSHLRFLDKLGRGEG
jgi:linoleoyl-CoA desaturase